MPRFSIVTPSFNQAPFIERTLRSVAAQDYSDVEHWIIDGGSTDGTVDVLRRWDDRLAGWVSEKDRGQSHAVNKGVELCTGDVVGWINSDDVYLPGAFRAAAHAFERHPTCDAVYGGLVVIDERERVLDAYWPPLPDPELTLTVGLDIYGQALFVRRESWLRIGGIDESLHMAMDYDFILRLLLDGTLVRIPRYLGALRVHSGTKTSSAKRGDPNSKSQMEIAALREKYRSRLGLTSLSPVKARRLRARRIVSQVREAGVGYLGFKLLQRFGKPLPWLAGLSARIEP